MSSVRVLVVDDDPLVRAALAMVLGGSGDCVLVGEATDGAEVPAAVAEHAPDVVLMDIRMPQVDGLTATERLRARPGGPEVIVLTTFDADASVLRALRAGASGFLLKDTRPTQLLDAIAVVASGDALLAPSITRRLIEQFAALPGRSISPGEDGLTDREREVLVAVSRGLSNQEIADSLHMGYGTVKTHVSHLLTKLDCRDRAQLVMYAYESGLTIPGSS